ncbi:MAG: hypothetical protein RL609_42 [Bacteroidota bacterium]
MQQETYKVHIKTTPSPLRRARHSFPSCKRPPRPDCVGPPLLSLRVGGEIQRASVLCIYLHVICRYYTKISLKHPLIPCFLCNLRLQVLLNKKPLHSLKMKGLVL